MQASVANNQTRLPRQLVRQLEATKLKYADPETKTETADQDTPPVDPAVLTATDAEPKPDVNSRENDPVYWKQRFKVTEGILRKTREELGTKSADFERQLTEMQGQIRNLQASAPQPSTNPSELLSPEQIEDLGADQAQTLVDTVMAAAKKQAQSLIDAELAPLRDKQVRDAETAAQDRKVNFENSLFELVPNYAEVDASDAWHAWLAEEDEMTGLQRQEILTRHVRAFNAAKVAKVFKDFEKASQPPSRPTPPVSPHGSGAASSDAPGPAVGALTPPSKQEIKDFYTRSSQRKVSAQERAKFEARLKLLG